jgi:aspartyl-tRNA(Asn)/glutamyl-tRNA(Gln) amidotransferase subunit B
LNDLLSALSTSNRTIADCPIPARHLNELVELVDDGKINSKQGKEVFAEMFSTGKTPELIVKEKGMEQESDLGAIESLCREVIAANPKSVEAYRAGKAAAINFLKGQVMKLSKGKANPNLVSEILGKLLS